MELTKHKLIEAEKNARQLFDEIGARKLIVGGKTELELNTEIFQLAFELFGIEKYWHKRIVRSGANTLYPYRENPPDLRIREDDIVFFDFGPVFDEWEADFGRTYVVGQDPYKLKLKQDVESVWGQVQEWFRVQKICTGAQLYNYTVDVAKKKGWTFGGEIAGHIIGKFPHEKLEPANYGLYVHPQNNTDMFMPDAIGNSREWILEIHLIDRKKQIGGFFEQLLM